MHREFGNADQKITSGIFGYNKKGGYQHDYEIKMSTKDENHDPLIRKQRGE